MEFELLKQFSHIYFVCSGNIIRSAFAELYSKSKGLSNVSSFGTTYHNNEIHPKTAQYLRKLGISDTNSFRPTHISEISTFEERGIFFVMTKAHKTDLLANDIPESVVFLLSSIIGLTKEIEDPYFNNQYDAVFSMIRKAVDRICAIKRGDL